MRPPRWLAGLPMVFTLVAAAQGTPPPDGHPLIGLWRFDVPDTSCTEFYAYRADGLLQVSSGEERAQSRFDVDEAPSPRGFFKLVETLLQDNGLKDCTGRVTQPGATIQNFLRFHPSGDRFILCRDESFGACVGPFQRVGGEPA